ncbi:Zinc carboxypeptidase A 1 [Pseudolycoriella hygida]|uniref:Zinc carboxypeptidase A 1 n=1 Tax=Pseudolycoriella hygida TaxID=35572 RepID=A0A9Q0N0S6_9DIPT|nr:Zinc carboxypeptidase A 1 [Pseudolycoriella hygida]
MAFGSPLLAGILRILTVGVAANVFFQPVSYREHKLYEIYLERYMDPDIEAEIFRHIILDSKGSRNSTNVTLLVESKEVEDLTELLANHSISHDILNVNIQEKIDEESKHIQRFNVSANGTDFGWKSFHHLETINAWLENVASNYSSVVTKVDVSSSYEMRVIKGVKLSHRNNNSVVFIEAGVHSEEWAGPAVATFILNQLLTSNDSDVQYLAKNFDWIIFPVCNPDGYRYTFIRDRLWRKNRQAFSRCSGVDLNRNWNVSWTIKHTDTCSGNYPGTRPFSAPETKSLASYMRSVVDNQDIQVYLSFHSASQKIAFPYAVNDSTPPHFDDWLKIGKKAAEALARRYGTKFDVGTFYDVLYGARGTSLDWVYNEFKIPLVFLYSLRRSAEGKEESQYLLPVDQIEEVGWETLDSLVALFKEANALGYFDKFPTSQLMDKPVPMHLYTLLAYLITPDRMTSSIAPQAVEKNGNEKAGLLIILTIGVASEAKVRYDDHKLYEIHLNQDHQDFDPGIKTNFIRHIILDYDSNEVAVLVEPDEVDRFDTLLKKNNISHKILRVNIQRSIDAESENIKLFNASAKGTDFGWKTYYELETIYAWLDHLAETYSDLISVIDIGKSFEGRPIKGVKLSHKKNNTAVFIEAGIHGMEWAAPATATFILNQLLISTDPLVRHAAQNFDWIIFPVCNPDGYKYTFDWDRLWRKNRQVFHKCVGVDLNRNWDNLWSFKYLDACSNNFRGPHQFSAPETKALAAYLRKNDKLNNIKIYLSFHAGSQKLLLPYAANGSLPLNFTHLLKIGFRASKAFGKRYKKEFEFGSYYSLNLGTSGTSLDWVHNQLKVPIVFLYDLRRSVAKKYDSEYLLPVEEIEAAGWETLDGVMALLKGVENLGYYAIEKRKVPFTPSPEKPFKHKTSIKVVHCHVHSLEYGASDGSFS